jgi:hypothetical protein
VKQQGQKSRAPNNGRDRDTTKEAFVMNRHDIDKLTSRQRATALETPIIEAITDTVLYARRRLATCDPDTLQKLVFNEVATKLLRANPAHLADLAEELEFRRSQRGKPPVYDRLGRELVDVDPMQTKVGQVTTVLELIQRGMLTEAQGREYLGRDVLVNWDLLK